MQCNINQYKIAKYNTGIVTHMGARHSRHACETYDLDLSILILIYLLFQVVVLRTKGMILTKMYAYLSMYARLLPALLKICEPHDVAETNLPWL